MQGKGRINLKNITRLQAPEEKALVAPSLLAADFTRLGRELDAIRKAGAEILHLDVMDGHMVPNISFGIPVIEGLKKAGNGLLFDVHLMISEPLRYVKAFRDAGADHITFHLESEDNPDEVIKAIHDCGATAGMSIKPQTPAELLYKYLDKLEMILIMSVEPGFGGQKFMPEVLPKLEKLKKVIIENNLNVKLEIDGGIDENTAPLAKAAGADVLVAGSSVFRSPDGISLAIEKIR